MCYVKTAKYFCGAESQLAIFACFQKRQLGQSALARVHVADTIGSTICYY